MSDDLIYKILFHNQGEVYELHARHVSPGGLPGFVEVEGLLFGQRSELVVDPGEERLQKEFDGVRRFYVPFPAVIRIDEVERSGTNRITPVESGEGRGSVTPFPFPLGPSRKGPGSGE